MVHGTEGFFHERARAARRVALLSAALGVLGFLALLLLGAHPALRRALNDPKRFGFEGSEQIVRRIQLQAVGGAGPSHPAPVMNRVVVRRGRQGDGGLPRASLERASGKNPGFQRPELGESDFDLLTRAMRRTGGVPVFRSQDLVIEQLVEPEYPPVARDRGIEGRVALLARVDTTGAVVNVEVVSVGDERMLVDAATAAVLQCRFRPYQVDGRSKEVYAMFRFAFRLY